MCDVFCRSRSGTLLATGRSESRCSAGFTNADVKVGTLKGGGGGGGRRRGNWEVWIKCLAGFMNEMVESQIHSEFAGGCILSVFIHDLITCVMNAGVWSCTVMNESCRCGACSDATGLQASVPKMRAWYTLRLTLREAGGR